MTEYDPSPAAYAQFQRTQQRIAHWADDTAAAAPRYKSPFAPRSDAGDNSFYSPHPSRSSPHSAHGSPHSATPSSSRHHSPSGSPHPHMSSGGRHTPHRSHTHHPPPTQTPLRSPLRSATLSTPLALRPGDSISQAGGFGERARARARSHSPTGRHRSSRSGRSGGGTYVISPGYATPQVVYGGGGGRQYAYAGGGGGTQYTTQPQYGYGGGGGGGGGTAGQYGAMPYVQAPQPQVQPAAYVVYPKERKVTIVYPDPQPHYAPSPPAHGDGLLKRIFGSQSGHGRSRSRSESRSRSGRR